jgi:hypothetical protein
MTTRNTSRISCARSYRTLTGRFFGGALPRHFVPGYDHAVPPGQKPFAHRKPSHKLALWALAWVTPKNVSAQKAFPALQPLFGARISRNCPLLRRSTNLPRQISLQPIQEFRLRSIDLRPGSFQRKKFAFVDLRKLFFLPGARGPFQSKQVALDLG